MLVTNELCFSKSVLNSSSILPVKSSFGDLQIRIKVNLSDRQAYGTTDRPETKVETELPTVFYSNLLYLLHYRMGT